MTMPFNKFTLNKWVDEKLVTTTSAAPLHFRQLETHMKVMMHKQKEPIANTLKPLAISVAQAIVDPQWLKRELQHATTENLRLEANIVILTAHITSAGLCETEDEVIEWQEQSKVLINGVPKILTDRFEGQLQKMSAKITKQSDMLQEYLKWTNQLITAIANDTAKGPALTALRELNKELNEH